MKYGSIGAASKQINYNATLLTHSSGISSNDHPLSGKLFLFIFFLRTLYIFILRLSILETFSRSCLTIFHPNLVLYIPILFNTYHHCFSLPVLWWLTISSRFYAISSEPYTSCLWVLHSYSPDLTRNITPFKCSSNITHCHPCHVCPRIATASLEKSLPLLSSIKKSLHSQRRST